VKGAQRQLSKDEPPVL